MSCVTSSSRDREAGLWEARSPCFGLEGGPSYPTLGLGSSGCSGEDTWPPQEVVLAVCVSPETDLNQEFDYR